MDELYDRTRFLLEDPVRVDVALVCEQSALTKAQIGHKLGREPGSLSAVVTLEKRGALTEAAPAQEQGKRPGGKRWKLNPAWGQAVQAADTDRQRGRLEPSLDVVLVPITQTHGACDALASGEAAAAWGIPLRGEQMGLLLCPSGTPDEAATLRLLSSLASRGAHGLRLHVDRVLPSRELREWAAGVAGGGPSGLPPPTGPAQPESA